MAKTKKSQTTKKEATPSDPLADVELFDPHTAVSEENNDPTTGDITSPVSPLGPPVTMPLPIQATLQNSQDKLTKLETQLAAKEERVRKLEREVFELKAAAKQTNATIRELKKERSIRLNLEREMAKMEAEVQQAQQINASLDAEREDRLMIERKLATLEVLAERSQEMAAQLAEERNARVTLEREKATLAVQVESMQKLEQLLNEERQARMNAQSRASSAEARLARIEGELNQGGGSNSSGGILGRLRGN